MVEFKTAAANMESAGFLAGVDPFTMASTFLFQIGGRHVSMNFTEKQQQVLGHPVTQNMILFSMFFMGTRKISAAFVLWVVYFTATRVLLNENHSYNVLPRSWLQGQTPALGTANPAALYQENIRRLPG